MQVLRVCRFSTFALPPALPPCCCPLAFQHQVRRPASRMSSESYPGYPECVVSCHGAGGFANSIRFCSSNGGRRVTLTGLVILLLVLAPLLLGLGIEVRHHWTFLARLAFPLIGLAAFGFHPCPSLPTVVWYNRVTWSLWQNRAKN